MSVICNRSVVFSGYICTCSVILLPAYVSDFLHGLLKNKDRKLPYIFNSSFRYIDHVLSLSSSVHKIMQCFLLWSSLPLLILFKKKNILQDKYIWSVLLLLVKPLNQWPLTINLKLKDARYMPSSYKYFRFMSEMWHKRTI